MASHTFDWTKPTPETDHPAYRGRLECGDHNVVLLNGVDVSPLPITRIKTGEDGYVEFHVVDLKGRPVIDREAGEVRRQIRYGRVEYREDYSRCPLSKH